MIAGLLVGGILVAIFMWIESKQKYPQFTREERAVILAKVMGILFLVIGIPFIGLAWAKECISPILKYPSVIVAVLFMWIAVKSAIKDKNWWGVVMVFFAVVLPIVIFLTCYQYSNNPFYP